MKPSITIDARCLFSAICANGAVFYRGYLKESKFFSASCRSCKYVAGSSISAVLHLVHQQVARSSPDMLLGYKFISRCSMGVIKSAFRYYAPALGFLMFAVGVNSSERDFLEAFKRPAAIFAGYIGQFIVKPLLGYFFGMMSVTMFSLPTSIGKY